MSDHLHDHLHDPRRIHDALEPHAKRLQLDTCASCGGLPDDDHPLHLCVLPYSSGTHATPQLCPLCDDCAMEIAVALAARLLREDADSGNEAWRASRRDVLTIGGTTFVRSPPRPHGPHSTRARIVHPDQRAAEPIVIDEDDGDPA